MAKKQSSKIVGIAGGSGSGKSTLAVSLCKKYPDKFCLLHIDDYFKKMEEVPMFEGFRNCEDPTVIRFEDIFRDLTKLKNGEAVTIRTKSELYNPDYNLALKNKIECKIEPKPIILFEGYLALCDEKLRDLMDFKIYLDIPIEESTKRRSDNKFSPNIDYLNKVLIPMHKKFIEPTKKYADLVIDALTKTPEEILKIAEANLMIIAQGSLVQ